MASSVRDLCLSLPDPVEDQIFALMARFQSAKKRHSDGTLSKEPFTLGVGKFINSEGKTPVLKSVRTALEDQLSKRIKDEPSGGYLPIVGAPAFRAALEELVLGKDLADRVREEGALGSCQALGGTGGNFVQASFLKILGVKSIALSNPTWGNHKKIFPFAGLAISSYPYFDSSRAEITYDEMRKTISSLEPGSAISFHGCCHNPTGADLTPEQWKELCEDVKARDLVTVFDVAYAGFAKGLAEDLFSVRHFVEQKVPTLVAFSFSKIASLYEERIGSCLVALPEGYSTSAKVLGVLESIQRPTISNPPALVSRAITQVLTDSTLRADWERELSQMAEEIRHGGRLLARELEKVGVPHGGIEARKGMFAMLPFSPEQVKVLEEEEQVYMLPNGRINVAAVKEHNVVELAARMKRI
ncbi:MAG: aminotransferase class I/II-fold pyridoxal phosphate-dependent enzyme [Bdellovibrionales bacterium]|nr:aminotransferase class I/II-fold pyridoxal phosphate-dependent enzyme [Bdellovibrionales bacterium]